MVDSFSEGLGDQCIWEPLLLAPMAGAPELIVPGRSLTKHFYLTRTSADTNAVGEIPYQSRVSGREEYLPVCVAIMSLPRESI
jgi:hypothetical protein